MYYLDSIVILLRAAEDNMTLLVATISDDTIHFSTSFDNDKILLVAFFIHCY